MAKNDGRLWLDVIRTDNTFQLTTRADLTLWEGRCFHCNRKLWITLEGKPYSDVTLEHILPRHQGGTDHIENLALACGPCNHRKGCREDRLHRDHPEALLLQAKLKDKRRRRWRATSLSTEP